YAQLSYLNGFVEYDLTAGKIARTVEMPLSDRAAAMSPDDYPQNSAHHGMAMNADESRLCVAGTISDYVSIVSRPGLTTDGTVHYEPGALPYWTQTGPNGHDCYVSLSEKNQISVIDCRTARAAARLAAGPYPRRERAATLTPEAVGSLDPSHGWPGPGPSPTSATAARRHPPRRRGPRWPPRFSGGRRAPTGAAVRRAEVRRAGVRRA